MKVLRQLGQFELNEGNGMTKGLYNETKDLLMLCSDEEFVSRAKQLAGNNIGNYI